MSLRAATWAALLLWSVLFWAAVTVLLVPVVARWAEGLL